MKLLSQEKIQNEKESKEVKVFEKVQKLKETEAELLRTINSLREKKSKESKTLEDDLGNYRVAVSRRKLELTEEIKSLEKDRLKVLKPINEQIKEAQEQKQELEKKERGVKELFSDLVAQNQDFNQLIDERSQHLNDREFRLDASKKQLSESIANLNLRWKQYHEAVNKWNAIHAEKVQTLSIRETRLSRREIESKLFFETQRRKLQAEMNRMRKLLETQNG